MVVMGQDVVAGVEEEVVVVVAVVVAVVLITAIAAFVGVKFAVSAVVLVAMAVVLVARLFTTFCRCRGLCRTFCRCRGLCRATNLCTVLAMPVVVLAVPVMLVRRCAVAIRGASSVGFHTTKLRVHVMVAVAAPVVREMRVGSRSLCTHALIASRAYAVLAQRPVPENLTPQKSTRTSIS